MWASRSALRSVLSSVEHLSLGQRVPLGCHSPDCDYGTGVFSARTGIPYRKLVRKLTRLVPPSPPLHATASQVSVA